MLLSGGDDKRTLRGIFVLEDSDGVVGRWDSCRGEGGYDDFGAGMNVRVRDGDGAVVGSGSTRSMSQAVLADAAYVDAVQGAGGAEGVEVSAEDVEDYREVLEELVRLGYCAVYFDVEIDDTDFYAVEIGRRGEMVFSRDELAASDWTVSLYLG